jgi:hypothetical protein
MVQVRNFELSPQLPRTEAKHFLVETTHDIDQGKVLFIFQEYEIRVSYEPNWRSRAISHVRFESKIVGDGDISWLKSGTSFR